MSLGSILGNFRQFWATFGSFGQLGTVLGNFRQFWAIWDSFGQLSAVLGNFRQFWAIFVSKTSAHTDPHAAAKTATIQALKNAYLKKRDTK
jgi:hypothetical protein